MTYTPTPTKMTLTIKTGLTRDDFTTIGEIAAYRNEHPRETASRLLHDAIAAIRNRAADAQTQGDDNA